MATSGYEADGEEEIADDCFHMVTQYNWEEDIIWNGDDIKHKVKNMNWEEEIIWNGNDIKHKVKYMKFLLKTCLYNSYFLDTLTYILHHREESGSDV